MRLKCRVCGAVVMEIQSRQDIDIANRRAQLASHTATHEWDHYYYVQMEEVE